MTTAHLNDKNHHIIKLMRCAEQVQQRGVSWIYATVYDWNPRTDSRVDSEFPTLVLIKTSGLWPNLQVWNFGFPQWSMRWAHNLCLRLVAISCIFMIIEMHATSDVGHFIVSQRALVLNGSKPHEKRMKNAWKTHMFPCVMLAAGHLQHMWQMHVCVLWCSWQMAQLHGRNGSNYNNNGAEQWWNVKRSLEIHKIFDTVFGDEARTRVVRVLATQSGYGAVTDAAPWDSSMPRLENNMCRTLRIIYAAPWNWSRYGAVTDGLEQALNDTTANPGLTGAYDVLAIAPYFGNGATAHFSGRALWVLALNSQAICRSIKRSLH
jgi:hypothetical protein